MKQLEEWGRPYLDDRDVVVGRKQECGAVLRLWELRRAVVDVSDVYSDGSHAESSQLRAAGVLHLHVKHHLLDLLVVQTTSSPDSACAQYKTRKMYLDVCIGYGV